jgi:tRNA-specific adenosine deaminase 1
MPNEIPEPSFQNLKLVFLGQAIPFVGFGFMDNALLIIAGDAIDSTLGIYFGISTLCAAAIGNIISDLAGIGLGTMIEDFCANVLKLPVPQITAAQRTLRSVRTASNLGMAVGMTFGCILGMCPLLFIDSSKAEQKKKKAHLEALFQDVVTEAKTLVGAESTCLYLRVHIDDEEQKKDSGGNRMVKWQGVNSGKSGNFLFSANEKQQIRPAVDGEHLYAMYYVVPDSRDRGGSAAPPVEAAVDSSSSGGKRSSAPVKEGSPPGSSPPGARFIPIGKGIVSRAVLTGEAWNIHDVRKEPDYLPDHYEEDGSIPLFLKHMVVVPVLDGQGRTIAVIRALNKKATSAHVSGPTGHQGFTDSDVQILKSLASHISVSLQSVFRDEENEEMRLRDTIRILKEHGLEGMNDPNVKKVGPRRPTLFPS